jgi:DNA-binding transcriptional ArsR family regulator
MANPAGDDALFITGGIPKSRRVRHRVAESVAAGRILNQVVKHAEPADQLDVVFSALADPTRRAIVVRLSEGEASVSELAAPFDVTLPAVTKHLRVLERAGLLEHHKDGRVRRCRLVASPMRAADDWLASYRVFWEKRLDSLSHYVNKPKEAT